MPVSFASWILSTSKLDILIACFHQNFHPFKANQIQSTSVHPLLKSSVQRFRLNILMLLLLYLICPFLFYKSLLHLRHSWVFNLGQFSINSIAKKPAHFSRKVRKESIAFFSIVQFNAKAFGLWIHMQTFPPRFQTTKDRILFIFCKAKEISGLNVN